MATKPESTTDSTVEKYIIILEAIFQVARVNNEGETPFQELLIDTYSEHFEGSDYRIAVTKADKKLKRILKNGLELSSSTILKSVICPSAILQIGIIDFNKYQEEAKKVEESISSLENGFADKVKAFSEDQE